MPVCVYRAFHVGRREPLAPVRTKTSLPSVWTPKTSCPPATASRPEKRNTWPVGRRTWTSWRSSSQKAVNILSIATASFSAKKRRSWLPGSYRSILRGLARLSKVHQRRNSLPDILLRPIRGAPVRSDRWGRPGIAKRMEVPSWGREQYPPHTSPTIPAPARRQDLQVSQNMGPVK